MNAETLTAALEALERRTGREILPRDEDGRAEPTDSVLFIPEADPFAASSLIGQARALGFAADHVPAKTGESTGVVVLVLRGFEETPGVVEWVAALDAEEEPRHPNARLGLRAVDVADLAPGQYKVERKTDALSINLRGTGLDDSFVTFHRGQKIRVMLFVEDAEGNRFGVVAAGLLVDADDLKAKGSR